MSEPASGAGAPPPPRSSEPVRASVVVPTHQRRASVLRLCAALARQTVPSDAFEVVVVIDGSSDGTREALAACAVPFRLRVLSQVNRGRAAALNAGVAVAVGELVILLDDDMEPSPAFVEAHLQAHAAGARRGVMGAAPVSIDPSAPPATRYVATKFNRHLANLEQPDYTLRLTDFYSGNFSIRRALLVEMGGFDEDFRIYGNEDLELSHRLALAGVTLAFDRTALAHQYGEKPFAALARDSVAEGRTAVVFARKHPEVFGRLKLGTYHDGPSSLRVIRNGLLALSRRWSRLPALIEWLERVLARADAPGMPTFYRLALGYFYWVGVAAELRQRAPAGGSSDALLRLAGELKA